MSEAKRKYRGIYVLTALLGLASAFFMSRFSVCLGSVIDVVVEPGDSLQAVMLFCICMLLCWLAVSFIHSYTEILYVNKVVRYMKIKLYQALYRKELPQFLSESSGSYLSLYSKDIDLVVDNYLLPSCETVSNIFSAIVCLLTIFAINWKLGLSFIAISVATVVLSQIPGMIMAKQTIAYTQNNSAYMAVLENYLKGFEQIRLLGLGERFCGRLDQKDRNYEKSRKNYLFAKKASNDIGMSVSMLSQLLCLSVGIWFVIQGGLTVGLLISAVNLLNGVFSPLQEFVQDRNLMRTAKEIIDRIEENQFVEEETGSVIKGKVEEIAFRGLSLRFGDKEIFHDFNMTFEKGKKYAIVGESGKGKSTLMRLVMKYITGQEYEGTVLINGQDVTEISSDCVYDKIGYVQRNEFLIDGTVRDNILLYRDENSEDETSLVCRNLRLDDALVGKQVDMSNSGEVSFGEKQRIDIARFMVHNYDVLVFDEPTSNLDADTAGEIFNMIFNIEDKIVIVITHDKDREILDRFDVVIQL